MFGLPNVCSGIPSLEFTHLKLGNASGPPSEEIKNKNRVMDSCSYSSNERELKCGLHPIIAYSPASRPSLSEAEVQTESLVIKLKERESHLSGHGPYRIDRIKG
ncbi:hypothetical protein KC19_VG049700 [Ceratodon purpureus]|uniref:Uncharacterized protein n=1 Tax=Ceratodon purpureus TaxID=3225 RepID=A0A8T0HMJ8_CERPU|nr:hypothetical protein KC19_VG049700 [Ceratodon purpureus]